MRLLRGEADQETVYGKDPVVMARRWRDQGGEFLHVVDLDGAFTGKPAHLELISRIATEVDIPVEVGGGIRDEETVDAYLTAGINRVILGTRALEDTDWLGELCRKHPGRIAAGVDARDGNVAVRGWQDVSDISALELAARMNGLGLRCVIYTDISRDGTLDGPNVEATERFAEAMDAPVIASGGIGDIGHIRALSKLTIEGIIIGKALYAGTVSLPEAIEVARDG